MIKIDSEVEDRFEGLALSHTIIDNITVEKENIDLDAYAETVMNDVRTKYILETLKDDPLFAAYRDFFWRIGIDPTKRRPASEALVRRIMQGKPVPKINTLVDAYNLASIISGVPIGAFDVNCIRGVLLLRFAAPGEKFVGIGMDEPLSLNGGELVVSDDEKVIAVYPYRDSDATKITLNTKSVFLLLCGAPNVDSNALEGARRTVEEIILKFCGGSVRR